MRVITLNENRVKECCHQLGKEIIQTGFNPDLVLGVKTGGAELARFLHPLFSASHLDYCSIKRESKNSRANKFKKHLKKFPRPVLNLLRIMEAKFFFRSKERTHIEEVILPEGIEKYSRILIVDDAIDTGATINSLINELESKNNKSEIRVAVFTVTLTDPSIRPDFTLFDKNILLRFPWSKDF